MNISLLSLTITAPLAGRAPGKALKPSQTWAYRMAYRKAYRERLRKHGGFKAHGSNVLIDCIAIRSQVEVAKILGVTREAIRQTENRALSKVRLALLGIYRELSH